MRANCQLVFDGSGLVHGHCGPPTSTAARIRPVWIIDALLNCLTDARESKSSTGSCEMRAVWLCFLQASRMLPTWPTAKRAAVRLIGLERRPQERDA